MKLKLKIVIIIQLCRPNVFMAKNCNEENHKLNGIFDRQSEYSKDVRIAAEWELLKAYIFNRNVFCNHPLTDSTMSTLSENAQYYYIFHYAKMYYFSFMYSIYLEKVQHVATDIY